MVVQQILLCLALETKKRTTRELTKMQEQVKAAPKHESLTKIRTFLGIWVWPRFVDKFARRLGLYSRALDNKCCSWTSSTAHQRVHFHSIRSHKLMTHSWPRSLVSFNPFPIPEQRRWRCRYQKETSPTITCEGEDMYLFKWAVLFLQTLPSTPTDEKDFSPLTADRQCIDVSNNATNVRKLLSGISERMAVGWLFITPRSTGGVQGVNTRKLRKPESPHFWSMSVKRGKNCKAVRAPCTKGAPPAFAILSLFPRSARDGLPLVTKRINFAGRIDVVYGESCPSWLLAAIRKKLNFHSVVLQRRVCAAVATGCCFSRN